MASNIWGDAPYLCSWIWALSASVDCLCYGTDVVIENHNIGGPCSQRRGSDNGNRDISARKYVPYRHIVDAIADYGNRLTIFWRC